MYYSAVYDSPIGRLTLCAFENKIAGLWMDGQKYFGASIPEKMIEKSDYPVFDRARAWLDSYFSGQQPKITDLPLSPIGGDFRQGVWQILCEIPYGQVITYGDIAKKMAARLGLETMSGQAVGGAVGHNPISIIIPCHRVVGTNGSLTGFAGGVQTKIKLLEHEGVDTSRLFVPKNQK